MIDFYCYIIPYMLYNQCFTQDYITININATNVKIVRKCKNCIPRAKRICDGIHYAFWLSNIDNHHWMLRLIFIHWEMV